MTYFNHIAVNDGFSRRAVEVSHVARIPTNVVFIYLFIYSLLFLCLNGFTPRAKQNMCVHVATVRPCVIRIT